MMKTDRHVYSKFAAIALTIAVAASACTTGDLQIYGLGDVVDVGFDTTMVLSSVEFRDDVLEAMFTIENVGAEDLHYNLVLSLQARDTEGTPMAQVIPCGSNLDGVLQPGEEITGTMCWNTDGAEIVRIHYIVALIESDIVWEVER